MNHSKRKCSHIFTHTHSYKQTHILLSYEHFQNIKATDFKIYESSHASRCQQKWSPTIGMSTFEILSQYISRFMSHGLIFIPMAMGILMRKNSYTSGLWVYVRIFNGTDPIFPLWSLEKDGTLSEQESLKLNLRMANCLDDVDDFSLWGLKMNCRLVFVTMAMGLLIRKNPYTSGLICGLYIYGYSLVHIQFSVCRVSRRIEH